MDKQELFAFLENQGKTALIGLYGSGGFGREVMPILEEYSREFTDTHKKPFAKVCFIQSAPEYSICNDTPVFSEAEFFSYPADIHLFNIAIGNSEARQKLAAQCIAQKAIPLQLASKATTNYKNNELGDGAIICANSVITANAKIGRFFHSNIFSYVGHDCIIGDFVTFAPRVCCNGNVVIKDHAYIGTNAMLRQGTSDKPLMIGKGATVGMGAVVTKDVPDYATVVGNPARLIEKT